MPKLNERTDHHLGKGTDHHLGKGTDHQSAAALKNLSEGEECGICRKRKIRSGTRRHRDFILDSPPANLLRKSSAVFDTLNYLLQEFFSRPADVLKKSSLLNNPQRTLTTHKLVSPP
ncbi:hypothetical protein EUTSA_v10023765mg [Eutrema salsugineum]|uniref:Uncharacterized protein n=1 Tax=Eutrema salsugineum TaxID=72664 RepID=V4KQG2_EUTSA|nr:hypothetical protein EUTSA_v10023765mg [Eutrema salsugineum]